MYRKWLYLAAAALGVMLVATMGAFIGGALVQKHQRQSDSDSPSPSQLQQISTPRPAQALPIPQPVFICKGYYAVQAHGYSYFPFHVDGAAVVAGNFHAYGGTGNDIEIVIGPGNDVLNALNGHGGNLNYVSGKMTIGNVLVRLTQPGDYMVALNNTFSAFTGKNVWANIRFTPVQQAQ